MNQPCPSCQTRDYGTPFCVSCQKPMLRQPDAAPAPPPAIPAPAEAVIRAGFWRRFAAIAIDWLVLSILADILRFAYRFGSGSEKVVVDLDVSMGVSALLIILYFTLMTGEGGQTLGKMLLGIRVRLTNGSPVRFRRALLRTLGYFVSAFFFTFLGFLWALWDPRKETWHDKIAGTEVIRV